MKIGYYRILRRLLKANSPMLNSSKIENWIQISPWSTIDSYHIHISYKMYSSKINQSCRKMKLILVNIEVGWRDEAYRQNICFKCIYFWLNVWVTEYYFLRIYMGLIWPNLPFLLVRHEILTQSPNYHCWAFFEPVLLINTNSVYSTP